MTVEHSTTDKDVCLSPGKPFKSLDHLLGKRLTPKLLHQLLIIDSLGDSINDFTFDVPRGNFLLLGNGRVRVGGGSGAHKSKLALVSHHGWPFKSLMTRSYD